MSAAIERRNASDRVREAHEKALETASGMSPQVESVLEWEKAMNLALNEIVGALAILLDHAERIQEHVPKSENWYVVRDEARRVLGRSR